MIKTFNDLKSGDIFYECNFSGTSIYICLYKVAYLKFLNHRGRYSYAKATPELDIYVMHIDDKEQEPFFFPIVSKEDISHYNTKYSMYFSDRNEMIDYLANIDLDISKAFNTLIKSEIINGN